MNVAVGKRRAVVEDEEFRAGARSLDLLVETGVLSFLEHLRLARGEV